MLRIRGAGLLARTSSPMLPSTQPFLFERVSANVHTTFSALACYRNACKLAGIPCRASEHLAITQQCAGVSATGQSFPANNRGAAAWLACYRSAPAKKCVHNATAGLAQPAATAERWRESYPRNHEPRSIAATSQRLPAMGWSSSARHRSAGGFTALRFTPRLRKLSEHAEKVRPPQEREMSGIAATGRSCNVRPGETNALAKASSPGNGAGSRSRYWGEYAPLRLRPGPYLKSSKALGISVTTAVRGQLQGFEKGSRVFGSRNGGDAACRLGDHLFLATSCTRGLPSGERVAAV